MYDQVIELVKSEGDKLLAIAGTVKDSFNEKQWNRPQDVNIAVMFDAYPIVPRVYTENGRKVIKTA